MYNNKMLKGRHKSASFTNFNEDPQLAGKVYYSLLKFKKYLFA
jgi:hypothetical protein